MPDLCEQLQRCFQGSVCLMGLGNIDYSDDGFGVCLADAITQRLEPNEEAFRDVMVINAGTIPERFIGSLAEKDFDHLVFLDAVEFGGVPGSVLFLNAEGIVDRFPQISTHKISLSLMAKWIEESTTTKTWLLGVQPASLKAAHGLTPAVQTTLTILDGLFYDLLISGKQTSKYMPYPEERSMRLPTEEVKV